MWPRESHSMPSVAPSSAGLHVQILLAAASKGTELSVLLLTFLTLSAALTQAEPDEASFIPMTPGLRARETGKASSP